MLKEGEKSVTRKISVFKEKENCVKRERKVCIKRDKEESVKRGREKCVKKDLCTIEKDCHGLL